MASDKKYKIIYLDLPWCYANFTDSKNGAAVSQYPVLTDQDLVNLPVGDIAEKDALLFMWCTWPKLQVGLKCMNSYGFEFVTSPAVWMKTTKKNINKI
ncbi:MAG: MT-A70 family methyltransferase, partial [Nitrososphaerales archaeon]